jgi:hypothetical protein
MSSFHLQWKMFTCSLQMVLGPLLCLIKSWVSAICSSAVKTALLSWIFLPYLSSYYFILCLLSEKNYSKKCCKFRIPSSSFLVSHQPAPFWLLSPPFHKMTPIQIVDGL